MNLNVLGLSKFMKELIDVWDYRAQLTNETRPKYISIQFRIPFSCK